jgi:predicted RNA methylase
MDWSQWHEQYEQEDSALARRLRMVQDQIRNVLDSSPPGPLRVISLCAGEGRDLLGVLPEHPRRADVRALLVELDPSLAATATQTARSAGLDQVEIVTGDAADTNQYLTMVPADLVLICGVFGNLTDHDIQALISRCPQLCAP